MRFRIKLLFFAFVLLLSAAQASAFAQETETDIPASWLTTHAGYYAPYALHSAGAYLPVADLNKTRSAEPGSDAEYVVQSTFKEKDFGPKAAEIREHARAALNGWHYKFGSETHLSCIDQDEAGCLKKLPRHVAKQGQIPAFHVWALDSSLPESFFFPGSCAEVAITFRGTVLTRWADWKANTHYLSQYLVENHYTNLARNIDGIIKRVAALDCYKRGDSPRIVSSGHSLGGGLAQLAALANNKNGPKISKVFAFDPSPVTGAGLVNEETKKENSKKLEVDRIYQSGEILEYFRAVVQAYPPNRNECKPLVRAVKVDVLQGGPAVRHGMAAMGAELVQLSNAVGQTGRPIARNCVTRYEEQMRHEEQMRPLALVVAAFLDRDAEPIVPVPVRRGRSKAKVVNASVSFGPARPESDDPFEGFFSP